MRCDIAFALAVIFIAAAGCNRQNPSSAGPTAAPVAVTIVKPEMRSLQRIVEQPGIAQAFEETSLHAKLPGFVSSIADDPSKKDRPPHDRQIDIGSPVAKGQVLAELAIPELGEEWNQKTAQVRQVEAEVVQSERAQTAAAAGIASALSIVEEMKAGISKAQALYDRWQSELTRVSGLVKQGIMDAQTEDETRNQFKAAEANRNEMNARVASANAAVIKARADEARSAADVVAVTARLDVARAEVRRVDALRSYTKIKAPYAGVVTRRTLNIGDFVTGNEKYGLFTVARIDPVRVVVDVPESEATAVTVGLSVRLTLAGPEHTGQVARTSWSLAPGSRTLRTEIDVPNEKGLLRPGTYVSAKLTVELPAALTVPAAAVGKFGDEPIIYLVEGGKAIRMVVQLNKGNGQFTQIRRYKKPGATDWINFTGAESIAIPAAAVSDGQQVQ
jgi:multidrug resistance efflux pump